VRSARLVIPLVLAVMGVGVASAVVWRASTAAFTANTTNGSNSWSTGSLSLTDNDSGVALFNVVGLTPGQTATKCIRVTYTGDLTTSTVKLYASASSATNALDTFIDLSIDQGSGASSGFGNCTGFTLGGSLFTGTLNSFATTKATYANGVDAWTPAPAATRDYRITYTVNGSITDTQQGSSATLTLKWEAQA